MCAGFEDPEVMAAVNDVAQNPQNMKKYKDNQKVSAAKSRPLYHVTIQSYIIGRCGV